MTIFTVALQALDATPHRKSAWLYIALLGPGEDKTAARSLDEFSSVAGL
jgi:hypothetical protein